MGSLPVPGEGCSLDGGCANPQSALLYGPKLTHLGTPKVQHEVGDQQKMGSLVDGALLTVLEA